MPYLRHGLLTPLDECVMIDIGSLFVKHPALSESSNLALERLRNLVDLQSTLSDVPHLVEDEVCDAYNGTLITFDADMYSMCSATAEAAPHNVHLVQKLDGDVATNVLYQSQRGRSYHHHAFSYDVLRICCRVTRFYFSRPSTVLAAVYLCTLSWAVTHSTTRSIASTSCRAALCTSSSCDCATWPRTTKACRRSSSSTDSISSSSHQHKLHQVPQQLNLLTAASTSRCTGWQGRRRWRPTLPTGAGGRVGVGQRAGDDNAA